MSLEQSVRKEVILKHRIHDTDSGSPQVQIALITARLEKLTQHFKTHVKDHHSRRGLMKMVGKRRRLLKYLHQVNPKEYQKVLGQLDIRK